MIMSRTTTEQDFAQMGRDLAEAHVAKGNGHGVILDADGTLFENLLDGGEFQNFFFPEVITTASSNPKTNGGYAHPNTPIAKDVKVDGGNLVRSDGNVVRNPISPQGHQMLTAYFEALQKNGTPVYIVTMNRVGNIESVLGANGFLQYVSGISAIEGIHPVVNGEVGRVTEDSPSTHASTRSGEVKKLKAIKKIREDTKLGFDMIDDEFSRKGEIPTGFKGLVTEVSLMTAPKWIITSCSSQESGISITRR